MKNLIKYLRVTASGQDMNSGLILFVLIFIVSVFDVIGVASIFPFMSLVSDPNKMSEMLAIQLMTDVLNISTDNQLIVTAGILLILILISTAVIRLITAYKQTMFVQSLEKTLSTRLLAAYLAKTYTWHLENNTGDIGKNILSEVNLVVNNFLISIINFFTQILLSFLILAVLFFINPILSGVLMLVGILSYLILFVLLRQNLVFYGEKRAEANTERYTIVNEALNAFREVELNALQNEYAKRFYKAADKLSKYQAKSQFIYIFPKYVLEALVFVAIIAVITLSTYEGNSIEAMLPTLALFALAGYKLLPAANQIYVAVSMIKYCHNALETIYTALEEYERLDHEHKHVSDVEFENIKLSDVSYSYNNSSVDVLHNINFTLFKGEMVSLVGTSGSGKSTIIDVMMKLMEPKTGSVKLNGNSFDRELVRGFRKIVGYVPQKVFLSDDKISNNITLSRDTRSNVMLEKAIETAELSDFVASLPQTIDSVIGEGGDRISGGQRQRIGIARALYKNPQILVFDEAMSALDPVTEEKILRNIKRNFPNVSIVTVTHTYSNLKNCDKIYLVSDGKIKHKGDFKYLFLKSEQFRELTKNKEENID